MIIWIASITKKLKWQEKLPISWVWVSEQQEHMIQDLKINLEWLNGLFWENYIVCLIYYPGIKVTDYLVGHREPNTRIDSIFRFWISMRAQN